MDDAQIEAEINKRLAAESNQAGSEDTVSSDYQATQAKLLDAEKRLHEKEDKNKSSIPGVDIAKGIYSGLPEDVQPYALGAAGYIGGKALRAALPEEKVMGTNAYHDVQKERAALAASEEPAHRTYVEAHNAAVGNQESHQAKANLLEAQHAMAQQQHEAALEELKRAHAQHAHAQTLNVDEELARRSPGLGIAGPSSVPTQLTPQPRGGEGTASYAMKFGATPEEAARVASMSTMQQQNIPAQAQAWQKINRIEPGFQQVSESPLLLGSEGQKVVAERLGAVTAEEHKQKTHEEHQRKQMMHDLSKHKAATQLQLENALENARLNAKSVAAALKAHHAHVNTAPTTPSQQAGVQNAQSTLADIQSRIAQTEPSRLAKFGIKMAGRFVPGAGAAFAPIEAEAAYKDFLNKNYLRAGVHGLGALGAAAQATGIPPLMGAGDIAQMPAAGLSIYDLINAEKSGQ